MKILILDDEGTVLYEQEDPGYIHLPIICDTKYDVSCDENDCQDPRCQELRTESEEVLRKWQEAGQELSFIYHLVGSDRIEEFEKLPNHDLPSKVKLRSFTRNELVLDFGDGVQTVPFECPSLNPYSGRDDQVDFTAADWKASLSVWSVDFYERMLELKLHRSAPVGKH